MDRTLERLFDKSAEGAKNASQISQAKGQGINVYVGITF